MQQLKQTLRYLMAIDSTTGFFVEMDEYLLAQAKRMGFEAVQLNKGGVRIELGGEGNPVTIAAHSSTSAALITWLATVAIATPATSRWNTITSSRFSSTFTTPAIIR